MMSKDIVDNFTSLLYHFTDNSLEAPVFPYITAITGHRSFAQPGEVEGIPGFSEQDIKAAFKSELQPMAELWQKSCCGTAPFILLTGLADGADQIAAEAALELPDELNVKVVTVLPMEEDLYIETIENKERFRLLLHQSSYQISLPLTENNIGHESDLARICDETEFRRQEQYILLSHFLALHSHVLFAFWDGIPSPLKGGTANTIFFKLNGNTETQKQGDLLTFSSVGPVIHLLIPRNNQDNLNNPLSADLDMTSIPVFYLTRNILRENYGINALTSDENPSCDRTVFNSKLLCKTPIAEIDEIKVVLNKIGKLNADIVKNFKCKSFVKKCTDSYNDLFNVSRDNDLQQATSNNLFSFNFDNLNKFEDNNTRILAEHFAVADQMANAYQLYTQWMAWLYSVVFAVLSFIIGLLATFWSIRIYRWAENPDSYFHFVWTCCSGADNPFAFNCLPKLSKLYIFFSVVLLVIYVVAKCQQFHYHYHRFRAIAEALRIQIYWRIAGISDCVSDYYRSHQIPETEWIRAAINGLDVFRNSSTDSIFRASLTQRIQFVNNAWVLGQRNYFAKAKNKRMNHQNNTSNLIRPFLLFLVGLFFCLPLKGDIIKLIYGLETNQFFGIKIDQFNAILLFVILGFAISFITSSVIYNTMLLKFKRSKVEAKRFEQMLFPFDRAALLLNSNRPIEEQQLILRQLGTEAVSENVSWLLTVGEQDLSLPR